MFTLPPYLHPMVVHFPIALFIVAVGLDIMSLIFKKKEWHQSALTMYVLAALFTPLVIRTGIIEAVKLKLDHPLLDEHRTNAIRLMWLSLASLPILYLVKNKWSKGFRIIFIIFLISMAGLVSFTAHKGGQMVYEYGVGVEE